MAALERDRRRLDHGRYRTRGGRPRRSTIFSTLEAGGWKGKAGTAIADHEDLLRFIVTAVGELAVEGKAAINRILVDGRAIAAAIVLRSGRLRLVLEDRLRRELSRAIHRASC